LAGLLLLGYGKWVLARQLGLHVHLVHLLHLVHLIHLVKLVHVVHVVHLIHVVHLVCLEAPHVWLKAVACGLLESSKLVLLLLLLCWLIALIKLSKYLILIAGGNLSS